MSGCTTVLLVLLGVAVLGSAMCGVMLGLARQSPEQASAAKKRDDDLADAAAAYLAADRAKNEAETRAECRVKDGGAIFFAYTKEIREACRAQVRAALTVPGSGEFDELEPTVMSEGGCNRIITSTFTAKNAFGVTVRQTYRCVYEPTTGLYTIKTL